MITRTEETEKIVINYILGNENKEKLIRDILNQYVRASPQNVPGLISYVNDLLASYIINSNNRIDNLINGSLYFVGYKDGGDNTKIKNDSEFAFYVNLWKNLIPDGNTNGLSTREKASFIKMIEYLKNNSAIINSEWARSYDNKEFLQKVYDMHVANK
jgi:hypothetical protein